MAVIDGVFRLGRARDFSEVRQFHARHVNGTLLSEATINASITDVARGHLGECKRTSRPQVVAIVFRS